MPDPSPLSPPVVLARLKREHPDRYRELSHRYLEAFQAVERDGVLSWDDNTDVDVEEQLWSLKGELASLYAGL
jgi:hypothetical protein